MRTRVLGVLVLTLGLLPSCGGGGGGGGSAPGSGAGGALVLVRSSLGCDLTRGNERCRVAPNLPLVFTFNQDVDPTSVTDRSLFLRKSGGTEKAQGTFLVQGPKVSFLPSVRWTGKALAFGLEAGVEYELRIPAGGLRSAAGASLAADLGALVEVSKAPADPDGKAPQASLLSPDKSPAPLDSLVVVRFSEFVRPQALLDGSGWTLEGRRGQDPWVEIGARAEVRFDQKERTTQLTLTPGGLFPSQGEIRITLKKEIQDLSGRALAPWSKTLPTGASGGKPLVLEENFQDSSMADPEATGAAWAYGGNPGLRPGRLGGPGILGEFVAPRGKTLVIRTEDSTWPGTRTHSGLPIRVRSGAFFFQRFEIPEDSKVIFQGTNPVRLYVAGDAVIRGELICDGEDAAPYDGHPYVPRGEEGAQGGPGGGRGGQGGGQPVFSRVKGFPGQDVWAPLGHPRWKEAQGTGGAGAPGFPESGSGKDVRYEQVQGKWICRQVAAGGGGGSLFLPGTAGKVVSVLNPSLNRGAPAKPGRVFPVLPLVQGVSSQDLFLLGGAGGGGGGAHPYGNEKNIWGMVDWRSAGGGAGGGGALLIRAGRDIWIGGKGLVSSRGGSGATKNKHFAAPGGGGSGGGILFQCAGSFFLGGKIDVSGGKGGVLKDSASGLEVRGGDGGPGFFRLETDPPFAVALLKGLVPKEVRVSGAVGKLADSDPVTSARSLVYRTKASMPRFLAYELRVREGKTLKTYSDDPARGIQPVPGVTPVFLVFQGVKVEKGKDPQYLPWGPTLAGISSVGGVAPNGVRFVLSLDRSLLPPGTNLVVEDLKIFYLP